MSDTPTFEALGVRQDLLEALRQRGFENPTPVQAEAFAPGQEGRDLLVQSRTGSGKTLAFGLPLLHRLEDGNHPQALVLAPTRELAQQVMAELRSLKPGLTFALLVGGLSYGPQLKSLEKGVQLVVGTPGRVIDHLDRKTLDLSRVHMLVLDECDEMLNMGFLEDVERILSEVKGPRQTFLFSATLPGPIAGLAKRFLKDPVHLKLAQDGGQAHHADIAHTPVQAPERFQTQALVNVLLHDDPTAALIFTKTKQATEDVAEALTAAGLPAAFLHGDLAQATRTRTLAHFKEGRIRFLVATDVAARGLDVEGLPLVVHMGIPTQMEPYIHRSGRTGRAGSKGTSMALVNPKEARILGAWSKRGGLQLQWRVVPSPDAITEARGKRLETELTSAAPGPFRERAQALLEKVPAEELVARLLAHLNQEQTSGYPLPNELVNAPAEPVKGPWKPYNDRPDRPYQDRGPRTYGNRPEGERRPFDRDRKPYGDRPARPRQEGDAERRPFRPREDGERRPYDRENRPAGDRPYGDRPQGERSGKPFEHRKPYDKKPYGAGPREDRPKKDGERREWTPKPPFKKGPKKG